MHLSGPSVGQAVADGMLDDGVREGEPTRLCLFDEP